MEAKKVGRKSRYRPSMVQEILKLAEKHYLIEIADIFGVHRKTMFCWSKDADKKEFGEAYRLAEQKCLVRFIREGLDNIDNRGFNSRMWEQLYKVMYMNETRIQANLDKFASSGTDEQIQIALRALERGELKSSELKEIVETLRAICDIKKGAELERRINELEKKIR
jgi:hypothetical protein